jgi:hypothetical protein
VIKWKGVMAHSTSVPVAAPLTVPKKKPVSYSNLLLGAGLNMFEYVLNPEYLLTSIE